MGDKEESQRSRSQPEGRIHAEVRQPYRSKTRSATSAPKAINAACKRLWDHGIRRAPRQQLWPSVASTPINTVSEGVSSTNPSNTNTNVKGKELRAPGTVIRRPELNRAMRRKHPYFRTSGEFHRSRVDASAARPSPTMMVTKRRARILRLPAKLRENYPPGPNLTLRARS